MVADTAAVVYWSGMVVLFFFWVYGIVSFAFDLRNKIIPGVLQYRRGRRKRKAEREREQEREEKEQQLY
ncbi:MULTISPECIES: hypothetical protein [Halomicrobium]|uniref:CcmD family protein n=2 Tax=Halomicrobium mukohataei TaxID=57705 RepID=C7NXE6_HALMD|nr:MULTISPECIES: hypothetical protein [Halomicrobium]ACV48380.1 conserved hypothetical protein [Halomicrobium mukohataei DSM 12286]QCD66791.1 hypothetical protein E5139_14485 [Halomicrobium mukohataei]QFR21600.1 hypothetical protein GBQ70_14500 [Halomicrobium sp. ZPS1]